MWSRGGGGANLAAAPHFGEEPRAARGGGGRVAQPSLRGVVVTKQTLEGAILLYGELRPLEGPLEQQFKVAVA